MKQKYVICQADTPQGLEQLVNEQIEDGYEPLGGVSYIISRNSDYKIEIFHRYTQATIYKDTNVNVISGGDIFKFPKV